MVHRRTTWCTLRAHVHKPRVASHVTPPRNSRGVSSRHVDDVLPDKIIIPAGCDPLRDEGTRKGGGLIVAGAAKVSFTMKDRLILNYVVMGRASAHTSSYGILSVIILYILSSHQTSSKEEPVCLIQFCSRELRRPADRLAFRKNELWRNRGIKHRISSKKDTKKKHRKRKKKKCRDRIIALA